MPPIHELTDLERQTIRSAVVAELARTREQAAALARQFDDIVAGADMSNTDDEHDPEGTTIAFERSQVSALHSQALDDVAALHRTLLELDVADFGACGDCGGDIEQAAADSGRRRVWDAPRRPYRRCSLASASAPPAEGRTAPAVPTLHAPPSPIGTGGRWLAAGESVVGIGDAG